MALGPYGVGIFSQSRSLYSSFSPLVSLAATKGLTKYTSGQNAQKVGAFLSTAITSSLAVFIFLLPVVVLLSRQIAGSIFKDPELFFIVVAVYAWVFLSGINALYDAIFQSFKEIKLLSIKTCVISILTLATILPFLYFFRVTGVIVALNLSSLWAIFLSQILIYQRHKVTPSLRNFRFDHFTKLFRFGFANILTGLISSYSTLIIGVIIVRNLSSNALGIYQTALIIATVPTNVFQTAIQRYLFPILSDPNSSEPNRINFQNEALRLTLFLITPAFVLIIILSKYLLEVLFSAEFIQAATFLPIIILGEFVKNIDWMVAASILPMAKLKIAVLLDSVYALMFITLSHFFVIPYQLAGIASAFLISYLIFIVIVYIYQIKTTGFFIQSYNRDLLIKCLVLMLSVTAMFYLQPNGILMSSASILLLAIWFVVSFRKEEFFRLGSLVLESSRSFFQK